ncbi:MAG: hypothetical protein LBB98_10870 [Treponema sp.]|jgi:hypothetical protein|nr:hypothetical protein [Treponema sp.]
MGLLSKAITAHPPVASAQASAVTYPKQPAGEKAVLNALWNYWRQNPSFQGIVLELPKSPGKAEFEAFFTAAASLAASIGRTIPLPSKNILILFSKVRDRELLTHRLVKSLRTRALAGFEAKSPGEAFSMIQFCL